MTGNASGSSESGREASSSLAADRASPARQGQPEMRAGLVTAEAVEAFLAADVEWARQAHPAVWQSLDYDRARFLLEAAAPLIAAAERDRIRALAVRHRAICVCMCGMNVAEDAPPGHSRKFTDLIGSEEGGDRG